MFRYFDHTADIGIRAEGKDLEELFTEAARALVSLIVENPEDVRPELARTFRLEASSHDDLLFDWLSELLFTFETEHLLFGRFDLRVVDHTLEATAHGERIDPARHRLDHEVKAVTYHGLGVERSGERWKAEVIVDV